MGITIGLERGWRIWSIDATRAYLQVKELSREVCMEPPVEAREPADTVWRLLVPVYGLNDAAQKFSVFMVNILTGDLKGEACPGDSMTILFFETDAKEPSGRRLVAWFSLHVDDSYYSVAQ